MKPEYFDSRTVSMRSTNLTHLFHSADVYQIGIWNTGYFICCLSNDAIVRKQIKI
jgi:hypothetical protein